jgi:arylsulfatase
MAHGLSRARNAQTPARRKSANKSSTALSSTLACLALIAGAPAIAQSPAQPEVQLPADAPPAPFAGTIRESNKDSTPDWPQPYQAPAGSPNVLLILTDDTGFGATDAFGGPTPTPNFDRLAAQGAKYNEFHVAAICSSTRAAMLTGRNHHAVSVGFVTDMPEGYPGYWMTMPKSAATIGRVMTGYGYNTAFFGKAHTVPPSDRTDDGPFDLWPTGLGFQYFFGFINGESDQWRTNLYRGISRVAEDPNAPPEPLDHRLADDAIRWVHNQKAADPDKPFFIYFATGSTHAPHQAPDDWIAKFKGQFDQGWDVVREQTFERQKAEGIIPADAALTPRPTQIPAWNSLSSNQKRAYARMMEVYAGQLAYQDAQIGRVIDELKRMGQFDNTLIIEIQGDNGASGEGGPDGKLNEIGDVANGLRYTAGDMVAAMPQMGSDHSYENYTAGWAWAMNTPFQWTKQVASHLGGTRDGMVISWPGHIKDVGTMRRQYSHVVDIYPTILEAAGVRAPTIVDGVQQQPLDGVSLAYTFADPAAPSRHNTQYYEMTGNRGIYHDGWLANTTPTRMPWGDAAPGDDPANYNWELYNLDRDYSQAHDIAGRYPDKLKEMQALFDVEAKRNHVYPLNSHFLERAIDFVQHAGPGRTHFVYWGADTRVAQVAAPQFGGRAFSLSAAVRLPTASTSGVLAATGSWFGGWSFYLDHGRPVAAEALSTRPGDQYHVEATEALPAGAATIRYEFKPDSPDRGAGGTLQIFAGDRQIGAGHIERTLSATAGLGETFDIGRDTGEPVTDAYRNEGVFEGQIDKVEISLGPMSKETAQFEAIVNDID